ncbi:MAG: hypothetical protein IPO22_14750 [Anaerolineales bacterium]|nr:hypothetical protein [Anaerolineales bacterium]
MDHWIFIHASLIQVLFLPVSSSMHNTPLSKHQRIGTSPSLHVLPYGGGSPNIALRGLHFPQFGMEFLGVHFPFAVVPVPALPLAISTASSTGL